MKKEEQQQFIKIAKEKGLSDQTGRQLVSIIEQLDGNKVSETQMQEHLKKLINTAEVE